MLPDAPPPDFFNTLFALFISLVSGSISIARRVMSGHPATLLWIACEFATAILCGYLMFNAYPKLTGIIPEWCTLPIAVAVAAHIGGRVFQELETELVRRYRKLFP